VSVSDAELWTLVAGISSHRIPVFDLAPMRARRP
jgi:hypothetical protein